MDFVIYTLSTNAIQCFQKQLQNDFQFFSFTAEFPYLYCIDIRSITAALLVAIKESCSLSAKKKIVLEIKKRV
jgi:hypothetical protein